MKIIIMAGGKATRFRNVPKQLMKIGNELLINRIIRQVKDVTGLGCTVITKDQRIINYLPPETTVWKEGISSHMSASVIGIKDSFDEEGRTFILHGDVIFTDDAIKKIFGCPEGLQFFGDPRKGELFGYKFSPETLSKVINGAFTAVNAILKDSESRGGTWELYRACMGKPVDEYILDCGSLIQISDETNDIDTIEQYLYVLGLFEIGGKI